MRLHRFTAPFLFFGLAACVEKVAGNNADVMGKWNLETVNGQALPVTLEQTAAERFDLLGDDFDLNADGSLTGMTRFRVVRTGGATETDTSFQTGSWTRSGNVVNLTFIESGATSTANATLDNGALMIVSKSTLFIYKR